MRVLAIGLAIAVIVFVVSGGPPRAARVRRSRSSTRPSGTISNATSSTPEHSRTTTCSAAAACARTDISRGRGSSASTGTSRWASTACTSGGTRALSGPVSSLAVRPRGSACTSAAHGRPAAARQDPGQPEGGPEAARTFLDQYDRGHLRRLGYRPAGRDPSCATRYGRRKVNRSRQELRKPLNEAAHAPGRNRTCDLALRRRAL